MKIEKELPLNKLKEAIENASGEERIFLEEQYYKRMRLKHSYSVQGKDYKNKYDTGEII